MLFKCGLLLCLALAGQAFGMTLPVPPGVLTHAPQTSAEDRYLRDGERLFAAGDWAGAEKHFRAAVKRQPANALWRVSLAVALEKQGRFKEAHAEVKKLLDLRDTSSMLSFHEEFKQGRIVFVNTAAFRDERTGIARLVAATRLLIIALNPGHDYLSMDLRKRIEELKEGLAEPAPASEPQEARERRAEAKKLQLELEESERRNTARFERLYREMVTPISTAIGVALDDYAKSRNIAIILDSSQFKTARFFSDKSVDVTRDFIDDFNTRFPIEPARPNQ